MNVRKHVLSALAGAAALAGVMITAPPANAEPNPPGCPKGYFCAYSEPNQGGTLLMKTAGDWSGEIHHVGSVFHNGYVFPSADHID
ncbi:peptidase inhibitor family I36 protein [Streptomyces sp. NPDC002835]